MEPGHTAFGMWSGGRFLHFGEPITPERLTSLTQRAYDKGVRTFLTADVYGNGESDKILCEALKGKPRDSYCLVGGIGHDIYKGERFGEKGYQRFTDPLLRGESEYGDFIRMATEKELERCGTSHFDLLFIHNPDRRGYTSAAVWDGMQKVKDAGLTKKIGIAIGPANGFTIDLINCFERFGGQIDWAMVILNPFEPWPSSFVLEAAKKHDVKLIARVVDYGGIFHDDVKPGHVFPRTDHRSFRGHGWVEAACEKLEKIRPIAKKHGLTPLQLACQWDLSHDAIKSVVPTLIQEQGKDPRPIESKLDELAAVPAQVKLSKEEVAEIRKVGDNTNCMQLKGSSLQYQGPEQADQWPMRPEILETARRWGVEPDRDLHYKDDPRDLREKGMPKKGVPQTSDKRLYLQLQVFTGANGTGALVEAAKRSGLEMVLYASASDPRGVATLVLAEDPVIFATKARDLLNSEPFSKLTPVPEMTMFGRTYGTGREEDLEDWLLEHPRRNTMNAEWPWAIWYPLRRKSEFYRLPDAEKGKILMEHGMIGRNFGQAGYAGDIRLECFGLDRDDNEFIIGVVGPRLDWLSKLIEAMRPTQQTSLWLEKLGPFFVGRTIWKSGS
ncbi:MAG: chlorite dismutase family protein [Bdellovibrionota bacterium]